MNATQQVNTLHQLITSLAGQCDGCATRDDVGFNGTDTNFGHVLARTAPEEWSAKMANVALKMLPKYHGQVDVSPLKDMSPLPEERGSVIAGERRKERAETVTVPDSLEDLPVEWSAAKLVNTRRGAKELRTASPTPEFWDLWRGQKDLLKARGISLGKSRTTGQWEICWWGDTNRETPAGEFAKAVRRPLPTAPEVSSEGLLEWQPEAVSNLVRGLRHWGAVLDTSDTGVGKTFQTLAAVREEGKRALVVCPLAVRPDWRKAAAHLGVELVDVINYEALKTGKTGHGAFTGAGKKVFKWTVPGDTIVIFDEAHRCKNGKTQNAAMLRGATSQNLPTIMASATIAENPMDLRVVGEALHLFPRDSKGFWSWAKDHGVVSNGFGHEFTSDRGARLEACSRINEAILVGGRGHRTSVASLGDKFPSCQIITQVTDYGKATKVIGKWADELEQAQADLRSAKSQDKDTEMVLTKILRARQELELAKAPTWVERAADCLANGKQVVLFVAFNQTLDLLSEMLETKCVIRGGQSEAVRRANIDAFQAGEEKVIIVNLNAGGVGVSLHGENRVSFIPCDFNARAVQQALGRIWRAGGGHCIQYVLLAAGTIEETQLEACQTKLDNIGMINDGNLEAVSQVA